MATPNLSNITTVTPGILASQQLASGDTTIYTVPANKAAKLAKLVLTNTSAAAVTVSVSVVPSGGSVDGTHRVVSGYSLAAGDSTTVTEIEGCWLGQGDLVSVNASTAAVVDVMLSGLVFA
ncbi:MAG: hypothetical protein J0H96_11985 [Microbacterium ginsengisoli]|jgi:hypothetical protein|nr:hypothetical protein [Microbacterium ginsengisoli]